MILSRMRPNSGATFSHSTSGTSTPDSASSASSACLAPADSFRSPPSPAQPSPANRKATIRFTPPVQPVHSILAGLIGLAALQRNNVWFWIARSTAPRRDWRVCNFKRRAKQQSLLVECVSVTSFCGRGGQISPGPTGKLADWSPCNFERRPHCCAVLRCSPRLRCPGPASGLLVISAIDGFNFAACAPLRSTAADSDLSTCNFERGLTVCVCAAPRNRSHHHHHHHVAVPTMHALLLATGTSEIGDARCVPWLRALAASLGCVPWLRPLAASLELLSQGIVGAPQHWSSHDHPALERAAGRTTADLKPAPLLLSKRIARPSAVG
ncbi:hypothetical protein IWX90DRAFT_495772 [Phyllosticta citrichinensis]|uniref:Uncharacterized protein n=1 Tax=Phyllosticta citrichinensis TaxID=1130410 RepID=A0ABR1XGC6_9PEZI